MCRAKAINKPSPWIRLYSAPTSCANNNYKRLSCTSHLLLISVRCSLVWVPCLLSSLGFYFKVLRVMLIVSFLKCVCPIQVHFLFAKVHSTFDIESLKLEPNYLQCQDRRTDRIKSNGCHLSSYFVASFIT